MSHRAFVQNFLAAIERDEHVERHGEFYAADVVFEELPNRLVPTGAKRDFEGIRQAAERGRAIVDRQRYEIVGFVENGSQVAVEAEWSATFKVDVAGLSKGDVMRARFAIFLDIQDGLIVRHRTYDCFEPW